MMGRCRMIFYAIKVPDKYPKRVSPKYLLLFDPLRLAHYVYPVISNNKTIVAS